MAPYHRWQFTRRMVNPLWTKGSGFEGYFVGLPENDILSMLNQFERQIWRNFTYGKLELCKFINNPSQAVSVDFANEMRITFEMLLAQAKAVRSTLQPKFSENVAFQQRVYSPPEIIQCGWRFNDDCFSLAGWNSSVSRESVSDIRNQFPALAEIGRFGFPPLRMALKFLTY